MKRRIYLVGMGLLLISMAWMSCAPLQKTALTKGNLSMLKGTWKGWTTFSSIESSPIMTTLHIANDTVPIRGNIVLQNLSEAAASIFPADVITAGNDARIDFKNGMISDQGTLIGQSGQNFIELTLSAGEKMKMKGWFYYYASKGTVDLTKQ